MSTAPPEGDRDFDDFLERPALPRELFQAPAHLFADQDMVAGRFRIIRFIGHGGMGEVYEAIDTELGTPVALKTIRPEFATDIRAIERFRGEVLQARSIGHPGVCRVFDLFTHDTGKRMVRFLTMELIAGVTLAERLRERGPMDESSARPLLEQIAASLTEAHRRQVVHRDLKPGNVMLVTDHDGRERTVITDFGLSVRVRQSGGSDISASERHAGTDDYSAPEQRAGGDVGVAADVFAFGVLMHEVLTGRTPSQIGSPDSFAARCATALRVAEGHRSLHGSGSREAAQDRGGRAEDCPAPTALGGRR
jgi:serine/threonine protein kinase